jgi:hypothetical protein
LRSKISSHGETQKQTAERICKDEKFHHITKYIIWNSKSESYVIGVPFPAGAGNFSLCHHIQTSSGAYPASYSTSTGGSSPGVGLSSRGLKLTAHLVVSPC